MSKLFVITSTGIDNLTKTTVKSQLGRVVTNLWAVCKHLHIAASLVEAKTLTSALSVANVNILRFLSSSVAVGGEIIVASHKYNAYGILIKQENERCDRMKVM